MTETGETILNDTNMKETLTQNSKVMGIFEPSLVCGRLEKEKRARRMSRENGYTPFLHVESLVPSQHDRLTTVCKLLLIWEGMYMVGHQRSDLVLPVFPLYSGSPIRIHILAFLGNLPLPLPLQHMYRINH